MLIMLSVAEKTKYEAEASPVTDLGVCFMGKRGKVMTTE